MPGIPDLDRRARFVEEYMVDMNGTRAALRAGFAPSSASTMASKFLRDPAIAAEIQKRKDFYAMETGVTVKWVVKELKATYARSMRHSGEDGEWKTGAVAVKCLELLGKHCGAFVERVELSGPNRGPINVKEWTDDQILQRLTELRLMDEQGAVQADFEEVEAERKALPPAAFEQELDEGYPLELEDPSFEDLDPKKTQ